MSNNEIKENLELIRTSIKEVCEQCGRDPKEVTLVAVSKTKPNEMIEEALRWDQLHFGENRMQELQSKMDEIEHAGIQWHMIGTMQSNKIKYIAEKVHWIHSVPKAKYLNEIEKRAKDAGRTINVLIQVNISGEDQKSGCEPSQLASILEHAKTLDHVRVRGLMGMATNVDDPEEVRPEFALLKQVLEDHTHLNGKNVALTELSMGMTNDYKVAIEEGATMVRIGSAIFGSRNYA
ncbi:MAG TPA: YggS family pyridoxal phosphate-dependent enzyme [Balneolaceae bacterium]|nr:YggS family pyridoxal phosphate-dependent enzyme [Balneolaceae bacterium]|tara:strand:+ start:11953 stop:12657 length:705 start_codon:yes stop_codon:yes gene_type:complete